VKVKSTTEFSNIYLFVSDALRYDSVPDAVADVNKIIKTVSSSGVSCAAFASLVSGLYPPQHGVWTFSDLVPDSVPTLYDLFTGDCPSHLVVTSLVDSRDNAIHYNDTREVESALKSIQEPFFAFDRELATHAVYGQPGGTQTTDQEFETTDDYWHARGADLDAVREDYARGTEVAAKKFEERLGILRDQGLLEDTLVVFTADHGEALGERGMVGHTNVPLAPEMVYVPTVFYNDEVTVDGDFMGHVDLFPTIASLIGQLVDGSRPGCDLTEGAPDDRMIFNADKRRGGHVYSAWDDAGGHTFSSVPYHIRLGRTLERLTVNNRARMHRQKFPTIAALPFRQSRTFGSPEFDRETAAAFCDDVFSSSVESRSRTLDEDAKEQLRALGYTESDIE
jgi:hypothetical protein